jgi:hypothetical protein
MEEQNKNENQTAVAEAVDTVSQPEVQAKAVPSQKFEMYSWFAMLLLLGVFTCSATIIATLAATI